MWKPIGEVIFAATFSHGFPHDELRCFSGRICPSLLTPVVLPAGLRMFVAGFALTNSSAVDMLQIVVVAA